MEHDYRDVEVRVVPGATTELPRRQSRRAISSAPESTSFIANTYSTLLNTPTPPKWFDDFLGQDFDAGSGLVTAQVADQVGKVTGVDVSLSMLDQHDGFDRGEFQSILERNGFRDVNFVTAHTINKEGKTYPIFLVTAARG